LCDLPLQDLDRAFTLLRDPALLGTLGLVPLDLALEKFHLLTCRLLELVDSFPQIVGGLCACARGMKRYHDGHDESSREH
jgi:hypothetical protein